MRGASAQLLVPKLFIGVTPRPPTTGVLDTHQPKLLRCDIPVMDSRNTCNAMACQYLFREIEKKLKLKEN